MKDHKTGTVNQYISGFPEAVQIKLEQIRSTIRRSASKAEEVISYGMPAYKQNGILVYFAAYANHIGFYPTGSDIKNFKDEISTFKNSKRTIQFPLDKRIPLGLIGRITKFRVEENSEKINFKTRKK